MFRYDIIQVKVTKFARTINHLHRRLRHHYQCYHLLVTIRNCVFCMLFFARSRLAFYYANLLVLFIVEYFFMLTCQSCLRRSENGNKFLLIWVITISSPYCFLPVSFWEYRDLGTKSRRLFQIFGDNFHVSGNNVGLGVLHLGCTVATNFKVDNKTHHTNAPINFPFYLYFDLPPLEDFLDHSLFSLLWHLLSNQATLLVYRNHGFVK